MKKFLLLIPLFLIAITTCLAQSDSYTIKGELDPSINGKFILVAHTEKGLLDINEAEVNQGKFTFTGRMPQTTVVYLMPTNKRAVLATLILENEVYNITLGVGELVINTQSKAHNIWNKFYELNKSFTASLQELETQARETPNQLPTLRKKFQELESENHKQEMTLMKEYGNTYVVTYIIASKIQQGIKEEYLKEYFNILSDEAKKSFFGKQIVNEYEKVKQLSVGQIAPNFQADLSDGGILDLHETLGKVKIIDFWASWCKPCRLENVNLVNIYKHYCTKGLEIISVSIDENKQAWLTAISQDGSTWKNVSDLKHPSSIAKLYNVRNIPCTYILDSENRIVAKNLRGEELERKISEMLKKKK